MLEIVIGKNIIILKYIMCIIYLPTSWIIYYKTQGKSRSFIYKQNGFSHTLHCKHWRLQANIKIWVQFLSTYVNYYLLSAMSYNQVTLIVVEGHPTNNLTTNVQDTVITPSFTDMRLRGRIRGARRSVSRFELSLYVINRHAFITPLIDNVAWQLLR